MASITFKLTDEPNHQLQSRYLMNASSRLGKSGLAITAISGEVNALKANIYAKADDWLTRPFPSTTPCALLEQHDEKIRAASSSRLARIHFSVPLMPLALIRSSQEDARQRREKLLALATKYIEKGCSLTPATGKVCKKVQTATDATIKAVAKAANQTGLSSALLKVSQFTLKTSSSEFDEVFHFFCPIGGGSGASRMTSGFKSFVISEKKLIARLSYERGLLSEKAIVSGFGFNLPSSSVLPNDFPAHLNQFLAKSKTYNVSLSKFTANQTGKMQGLLLYQEVEEGAVFLVQYSKFLHLENGISYSTNSMWNERLDALLNSIYKKSEEEGFKRIYLLWNAEHLPVATVLKAQSKEIVNSGHFSKGLLDKPLSLVEITP